MLKRIRAQNLQLGMYIHESCGSWVEHPFWRESFKLTDQEDLDRILDCNIAEVWIDTARGSDADGGLTATVSEQQVESFIAHAVNQNVASVPADQRAPIREELHRAARICAASRAAVTDMFQQARMGNAIDFDKADALVSEISASVLRNPAALISVARLKSVDDYTFMHSVAVCALMIALGRTLGLADNDLREAGLAGMLHDVGKMALPLDILNKPGPLTAAEFELVKSHPAEGHRMLRASGVSEITLDVCLHHHEKIDGGGYPERLSGENISLFSKMGSVCDVYDAITSDRPYKKGWDPSTALHKMAQWRSGHFDGAVFDAFVKSIGIFPIGALVRLHSGRLGVIVDQTPHSLTAPKVKVFYSIASGTRIVPEVVDLSRHGKGDKIASREDPGKWDFPDLVALWKAPAPG